MVVLSPEIKDAFNLTEVGVGAIAATERTAEGLVSAPAGIAADMHRRRWGLVLAVCMALFGVGWLVIGSAPGFVVFLIGVFLIGVAATVWHLPSSAALSEHFSTKRGTALGIHAIGGNVGDIVGPVLATGVLLGFLSWRGILGAYSIVPLVLIIPVYWAFRDIGALPGTGYRAPALRIQLALTRRLLKNRALWGINVVGALRNMTFLSMVTFLPIYFDDDLGMSTTSRGFHMALLMLVGMLSTPFLGYLSDRFGRKQVVVPSMLALAGLTILLVPFGEGVPLIVLIALLSFFLYGDQPILTATAMDIVGRRVLNTMLGVFALTRMAPSAAAPLIAGYLYHDFGIDAMFYYVAGLFALATVFMVFIPLTASSSDSTRGLDRSDR
jgi:FSR family fosmidomycin resistance protein-like MFS transporter